MDPVFSQPYPGAALGAQDLRALQREGSARKDAAGEVAPGSGGFPLLSRGRMPPLWNDGLCRKGWRVRTAAYDPRSENKNWTARLGNRVNQSCGGQRNG